MGAIHLDIAVHQPNVVSTEHPFTKLLLQHVDRVVGTLEMPSKLQAGCPAAELVNSMVAATISLSGNLWPLKMVPEVMLKEVRHPVHRQRRSFAFQQWGPTVPHFGQRTVFHPPKRVVTR